MSNYPGKGRIYVLNSSENLLITATKIKIIKLPLMNIFKGLNPVKKKLENGVKITKIRAKRCYILLFFNLLIIGKKINKILDYFGYFRRQTTMY